MLVPPIKTQVLGEALDLGTPKFNEMAKSIGQITTYFLHMQKHEVYAMQNVAVMEMKVREGTLIKHVKVANKSVNKMNKAV